MGEITELDTARTTTKHNLNMLFSWENDKRNHKNNTERNCFVTLVRARLHIFKNYSIALDNLFTVKPVLNGHPLSSLHSSKAWAESHFIPKSVGVVYL